MTAFDPRLESLDREAIAVPTASDPYAAAKDADAILVLTEWPEFLELDWASIGRHATGAIIVDTRNLLTRRAVDGSGLGYLGNGRAGGY
ncbi:MAG: hypothetical protein JO191_13895 [Mycobacteriaceae bacterium]|nr:hypothetical protein [Mycobacteriaceae bacterium]